MGYEGEWMIRWKIVEEKVNLKKEIVRMWWLERMGILNWGEKMGSEGNWKKGEKKDNRELEKKFSEKKRKRKKKNKKG